MIFEDLQMKHCDMFSLDGFASLPDASIDAVITDLPYGTLNKRNTWDQCINLPLFWKEIHRVCKEIAAIVTTSQMPYTAELVSSNYAHFKYCWVWEKSKATGYLNAKKQPLRAHEDICVFYKKQCKFNPIFSIGLPYNKGKAIRDTLAYGKQEKAILVKNDSGLRYPRTVLYFKTAESEGKYHPTQKPLALFQYLIQTYTDPGDLILDPCFGSGTTAIACQTLGRKFIGFEKEKQFYQKALIRISRKSL